MEEKTKRENMFKLGEGWERLRNIVRKYSHNIKGKLHHNESMSNYPTYAKIEFPLQLIDEIHKTGDFTWATENYPVLELFGIPKNFYLTGLVEYSHEHKGMKELERYYVDKIGKVEIKNKKVCLDVRLKELCVGL